MTPEDICEDIDRIAADEERDWPQHLESSVVDIRGLLRGRGVGYYLKRIQNLDLPGSRILDMGCGTCRWTYALAIEKAEVCGVDLTPERIELAKLIAEEAGLNNLELVVGSILDTPHSDESFDALICYSVVISAVPLEDALREMHRVLKPGGVAYINLNGMGWNHYLRDEYSQIRPELKKSGRDGVYNTICRNFLRPLQARLTTKRADNTAFISRLAPFEPPLNVSARKALFQLLRDEAEGVVSERLNFDEILEQLHREASLDHVELLGDDIAKLAHGAADAFSLFGNTPCGYDPHIAEAMANEAGFEGFRWAPEGRLRRVRQPQDTLPIFPQQDRNGETFVWDFIIRKPGGAPVEDIDFDAMEAEENRRKAKLLTGSGATKTGVAAENCFARVDQPLELRRYPHPYVCALSINNDVDGGSRAALDDWHDYVNGTGATAYGDGLGLEVSDSFWIWCPYAELSLSHTHPKDGSIELSPDAPRIIELAKAGFLDTLHSFGSWTGDWRMDRATAERGCELLDKLGIQPKIWSDHGGGKNFTHSISGRWHVYEQGDNPDHPSYCADLVRGLGVEFFWSAPFFELSKFGDYKTFQSQTELTKNLADYACPQILSVQGKDGEARHVISVEDRETWRRRYFNRTLVSDEMRDGAKAYFFKRYRGPDGPNAGNFMTQVNPESLDQLERDEAAVVIYQHFGFWRAHPFAKGHKSGHESTPPVLDRHNQWAFKDLAERAGAGRVLVTAAHRLLNYLRVRDNLVFNVIDNDGAVSIRVLHVACPVQGDFKPCASDLEGITFIIEQKPASLRVTDADGRDLGFKVFEDNDGRLHAASPWRKLDYIPSGS